MIHKAIEVATKAHRFQLRKGTDIPYIVHPFEVSVILAEAGAGQEVICAGILHDTVEDTDITLNDIRREFGERVSTLVEGRTEDKYLSWEERKQHTICQLKASTDLDERLLLCADKLSNIRSMAADYHEIGDDLWTRFRRGREKQAWYYGEILNGLGTIKEYSMYQELKRIYQNIFG